MTDQTSHFDYLLNCFEEASQSTLPSLAGYPEHRKALFAYVRDLERRAALAARPVTPASDWQQRAIDAGFVYVRASDDHWVECTQEQAVSLLIDVLNIRVEIAAPEHASAPEALLAALKLADANSREPADEPWRVVVRAALAAPSTPAATKDES